MCHASIIGKFGDIHNMISIQLVVIQQLALLMGEPLTSQCNCCSGDCVQSTWSMQSHLHGYGSQSFQLLPMFHHHKPSPSTNLVNPKHSSLLGFICPGHILFLTVWWLLTLSVSDASHSHWWSLEQKSLGPNDTAHRDTYNDPAFSKVPQTINAGGRD